MITRNSKPETRNCLTAGFTLIELVVVVLILSLVAVLVVPRFAAIGSGDLRKSARALAAALRYLEDQSMATKSGYRVRFGITDGAITVEKGAGVDQPGAPVDDFLKRRILAEGVQIEDVTTPSQGKKGSGEAVLWVGPTGIQEFAAIHLRSERGDRMTVTAYPASGRVTVAEGYQEERP